METQQLHLTHRTRPHAPLGVPASSVLGPSSSVAATPCRRHVSRARVPTGSVRRVARERSSVVVAPRNSSSRPLTKTWHIPQRGLASFVASGRSSTSAFCAVCFAFSCCFFLRPFLCFRPFLLLVSDILVSKVALLESPRESKCERRLWGGEQGGGWAFVSTAAWGSSKEDHWTSACPQGLRRGLAASSRRAAKIGEHGPMDRSMELF